MTFHIRHLEQWFRDRPHWLQDAARRLIQQRELSQKDRYELTLICKHEAGITEETDRVPDPVGVDSSILQGEEYSHCVRLKSLSNPIGINALKPNQPLEFDEKDLTIVYGANGAGKTGYVRVLKHACGARNPGPLYPNVFADQPTEQGCKIEYMYDEHYRVVDWRKTHNIHSDLSFIQIYDIDCAHVYVDEENELAYEPGLLHLLTDLTDLCDQIARAITIEMEALPSHKPAIPIPLVGTKSGKWWQQLHINITDQEIEEQCKWTDADETTLNQIIQRVSEPDPKTRGITIRRAYKNLATLASVLRDLVNKLHPDRCNEFRLLRKDAVEKRKAASEDAARIFENAPLEGVGRESWRLMWQQARAFSEQHGYVEKKFPYIGDRARCVLCQQELDSQSIERLKSFEEFVRGGLENQACVAEEQFRLASIDLGDVPTEENISARLDSCAISNELVRTKILEFRTQLDLCLKRVRDPSDNENIPNIQGTAILNWLEQRIKVLEEEAKLCDEDVKQENRSQLEQNKLELEARKWLSTQADLIKGEVKRLRKRALLESAKQLTNTHMLSRKKSELAEELITGQYINRFNSEIARLGAGRINVELVRTRSMKGRAFHRIRLKNNKQDSIPTSHVLSEGEFRIVSLAAFLADVEGQGDQSAFIFDDPISSLDQDYEEAMARRLVDLSKTRQVIVFTHRLSLLALLEEAAEKQNVEPNVRGIQRQPWGAGQPGATPILAQKTKQALNTLLDRVNYARKLLDEKGWDEYFWEAKAICSQTRITLEKLIERELLADVVQRFRRTVTTQGRLLKLARVVPNDCKYIDEMMTKYSRYEHCQPSESPIQPPTPIELETDLIRLRDWLEEFNKREVEV